ncbi:MAG: hypothetical protein ACLQJR_05210 [Stellaceae bacterium]
MKFFFDNCVSHRFAESIHALADHDGHSAVALRKMFAPETADAAWIEDLARAAEEWTIITMDTGEPAHPYRVSTLAANKLRVFVLLRSWTRHSFWLQAQRLVQWWPVIQDDADLHRAGTVHDVPYRFTRGRSLVRR